MLFIMGITEGRKDFDFGQMVSCSACGKYGQYRVFMLYTVLSLFFIPTIRWNRRYYVEMTCCGAVYELDSEIGRQIERGEHVTILPQHLTKTQSGRGYRSSYKRCAHCGYETDEDFGFCPKCGNQL